MPAQQDPVLSRRHLRNSLREARDKRGLTQQQVAGALDWSLSKVVRIENGAVGVSTTDLRALLGLYGISDKAQTDRLEELARSGRGRPYYDKYEHALDAGFRSYLSYERSASDISGFHLVVPGLLQTEDYTTALLEANGASHADERQKLRLERQEMLVPDGPRIHYIVDEGALHRQVGGPGVMRNQLRKLRSVLEQPKISFRIIPFAAGAYPSMLESFTILHSPEWDEDVLFRETTLQTVTNREDQELVAGYRVRFDLLHGMSLPRERVRALLDTLISDLRDVA
jgi:transcriptional regulator with XRE-family HTH domain